MPEVIVHIAPRGSEISNRESGEPEFDAEGNRETSQVGHMWYELKDDSGIRNSYGFAPAEEYEGQPFAPGSPYYDDTTHYDQSSTRTYEISEEQYQNMKDFGADPESHGFDTYYNGVTNSA